MTSALVDRARPARRLRMERLRGPLAEALRLLDLLGRVAWVPDRPPVPTAAPPDVRFGPVHTVFATAVLERTPTREDQRRLADALAAVEAAHPWRPGGLFLHIG